jgi:hypothetical protein
MPDPPKRSVLAVEHKLTDPGIARDPGYFAGGQIEVHQVALARLVFGEEKPTSDRVSGG